MWMFMPVLASALLDPPFYRKRGFAKMSARSSRTSWLHLTVRRASCLASAVSRVPPNTKKVRVKLPRMKRMNVSIVFFTLADSALFALHTATTK